MAERILTNFASGELSETLNGRVDLPQYYQGASYLKNFKIIPTGGIERRAGSKRLGALSGKCRLIPFIINAKTSYIIELSERAMRFWLNGELLTLNNAVFELTGAEGVAEDRVSLYAIDDVGGVQYAQNGETMVFAHRKYPPLILTWLGRYFSLKPLRPELGISFVVDDPYGVWTPKEEEEAGLFYKEPLFNDEPTGSVWLFTEPAEDDLLAPFMFENDNYYPGCVAFFAGRLWLAGTETKPGGVFVSMGPDETGPHYTNFTTYKRYVTVSRVLKYPDLHIFTGNSAAGNLNISGVSQNLTTELKELYSKYYVSGPGIVQGTMVTGIASDRITLSQPPTAGATSGVFTIQLWFNADQPTERDYRYQIEEKAMTVPTCGFNFELASEQNDTIRWLCQKQMLIIGTESGEWIIPAEVTANFITAKLNSRNGSAEIQAQSVGESILFFQQSKRGIKEYYYQAEGESFSANNMTMLAPQMLSESLAVDFDFFTNPYDRVFVTREDGDIAALLYEKTSGVMGWGRYSLGSGRAASTAVIPGDDGYDDVYFSVEYNGRFFLERVNEEPEVFLDGYSRFYGRTWGEAELGGYASPAVIWDPAAKKIYEWGEEIEALSGGVYYIGYPFESRMVSMPVFGENSTGPKRLAAVLLRFKGAFFPRLETWPLSREEVITGHEEPFTGVIKRSLPGSYDRDVKFIVSTTRPEPCTLLSVAAEVS
jgi:hypothetical protein